MVTSSPSLADLVAQWKEHRARLQLAYARWKLPDEAPLPGDGKAHLHEEILRLWRDLVELEAKITSEAPHTVDDVVALLDAAAELLWMREVMPDTAMARGPAAKLVAMVRTSLAQSPYLVARSH